jgi:hypothetical protein
MNEFSDLFKLGFGYLFSSEAMLHIALLVAVFAILKINDIGKGLIMILSFSGGILVNLLLLSFRIFSVQNQYWSSIVIITSILFALWNFGSKSTQGRRKSGNFSSRYLIMFVLGLINGVYVYLIHKNSLTEANILNVFGFYSGFFVSMVTLLSLDFVLLWLMTTFLRLKEQTWLQVVTGISIGMSITIIILYN